MGSRKGQLSVPSLQGGIFNHRGQANRVNLIWCDFREDHQEASRRE